MKNPWGRKNPLMSMWLSGANAAAGAARGRVTAEARRQASTAVSKSLSEMGQAWTSALSGKPPARRRRRKSAR